MILGIDASRAGKGNGTGIEVYSTGIIRALLKGIHDAKHSPFTEVVLYTPRQLSDEVLGGRYSFVEQKVMTFPRLWTQVRLSSAMISEPPDVLFIPSHVLPLMHPGKSVVTIHDVAFMKFSRAYGLAQRLYLRFSTWLAVREAAKIIVPSEAVKDDLVQLFSCHTEKIVVVPHGYDRSNIGEGASSIHADSLLESFGLGADTPFMLYVGRLEEKKNLVRTVQAFLKFRAAHPEWKLVLAGMRGHRCEDIFRVVEQADAWDCVVMPGYVTDQERSALYERCRFVTFVSLDEGFGFPILEAASFGKAVLMSDIRVMREVAGEDAGVFVDPCDVEAIADGMRELAASRPDVGARARLCSKYSWERAGEATLQVLTDVI